jgi:hypothetical protein
MISMKQPNRGKIVTQHKPAIRPKLTIPKVRVEITGADDATRDAIESAIVRALQDITPESVTMKWLQVRQ